MDKTFWIVSFLNLYLNFKNKLADFDTFEISQQWLDLYIFNGHLYTTNEWNTLIYFWDKFKLDQFNSMIHFVIYEN